MAVKKEWESLIRYYHENKLSHAYLIETNNLDLAFQDLKFVIRNMICPHEFQDECTKCNLCQILENNFLPSLIVIEPNGKNIKKEQILDLKSRFSTIPIYTKDNIYIIKQAECLNSSSANSMLKFLEEPENNILGFFLTNNINNVITTIKSRCEILKINYDVPAESLYENNYFENVYNFIKNIELDPSKAILENKNLLKNYSNRDDFFNIFKLILQIYKEAVENKKTNQDLEFCSKFNFLLRLDLKKLIQKVQIISAYLDELNYNVNMELFLDKLVIELSDLNE